MLLTAVIAATYELSTGPSLERRPLRALREVQVLADIYKTFPERIRVAREHWNQRAAAGDAAPRHAPVLEAQAAALLKKGSVGKAIKTHQIGII